jgi:ribosomal protein S18 acetylase RimI-like enzyme
VTAYDVVTSVSEADTEELWPVYDAVFADQPDRDAWRHAVWDPHTGRPGFRLARAYEDGRLVGFGYGYTGERGQWWTDQAAQVLAPALAAEWLGGHFELVSIGVLAEARGRGHATRLMRALTDDLPHARWVLMTTADADDPARHLYAGLGWQVIGSGLDDGQVIMGRRRDRPTAGRAPSDPT